MAVRASDSSYGAAWNIAPETLMFMGEPQVGGASSAPLYAIHFWNMSSGALQDLPNIDGEHDVQYDPVNNTFLTLQQYVQTVGDNLYLIDRLVELDANGNVLWTWNPYNYLPLTDASPYNETATYNDQTVIDFTHANTVVWDYNDSIVYVNFRNLNTFYKINQTSGSIIWGCGEFGNFTLLGDNGQPLTGANGLPPSLWYHCHTVEHVAPNVFMLFNNDFENNTNEDDCRSSLMEVTLNETSMTAYVNWSWEAPASYWDAYGGSIVHLPNGDFMGAFGDPSHHFTYNELPNGTWAFSDTGAVFAEVNPAGQIVRAFTFPVGCYVYRIETVTDPSSFVFAAPITAVATPTPVILPQFPFITATPIPIPSVSSTPAVAQTPTASPTPAVPECPSVVLLLLMLVVSTSIILSCGRNLKCTRSERSR
jgi:Arylsulfotransferase (ASST)